jgi:transcriptional regulator with XRE-family HTH domain
MAIVPVYEPYDVCQLGKIIRTLRKQAGLTQQQLRNKVNAQFPESDVMTQSFLSRVENGNRHMSYPIFKAVAQALNVPGEWLALMAFRCDSSSILPDSTARKIDDISKVLQGLIRDSLDLSCDSARE